MASHDTIKFSNSVLFAPLLAVLAIWSVYLVEIRFNVNLNEYGILPRKLIGLRGILCSPFLHGSIEHLYNNTIPLFTLIAALFYFYRNNAVQVLLLGVLLSGFFTWLIGRPSYHIGASGLIYVLVSFIFFKGILAKNFRLIALSLAVVFLYGSTIWYIFPIADGISWEGHLSGFVIGFVLSFLYKTRLPVEKKYAWEKEDYNEEEDEFLKHFDENGNFIENLEPPVDEVKVNYIYRENTEQNKD